MAYDAFISYSHTADGRLAPAVQAGLQRLARPWYRIRALRVFRDETGLAVNPHLWASIEAALDESDSFVLLASPESAASPWVAREIEHWLATKPADRILPVLTDGELVWDSGTGAYDVARSTALPAVLATAFAAEPRHLDLRWARTQDQLDLRHAGFRAAIAGLAAPMHGVSRDELEGEDVQQHRRTMRLAAGAAALLLFVTVAAVVASAFAVSYASTARANERRAVAASVRAGRSAREATTQRKLAIENAGVARSAKSRADANAGEAEQQRALAEANATQSAQNAAEATANGQEAQDQSIQAQHNAAEASANAAEASANAAEAQRSAQQAARSAADALQAAQVAAAQRELAQANAREAREQQTEALASATVARSRQLAASALNQLDRTPDRSLLLAVQANRLQSNVQAQDSLLRVIQRQPVGLRSYVAVDPTMRPLTSIATSPDGRWLVLQDEGGRLAVRDLSTGAAVPAPPGRVRGLAAFGGVGFTGDSSVLVLQSGRGVTLWDIAAGRVIANVPVPGRATAVAVSGDRRSLAVATLDGIHVYDVGSGRLERTWPASVLPSQFNVYRLALDSQGLLAVSGLAGTDAQAQVFVFDRTTGNQVATLPAEVGSCQCLFWRAHLALDFTGSGPDESLTLVASGGEDATLIAWNVGTWSRTTTLPTPAPVHDGDELVTAFDPVRLRIGTTSETDGDARVRDLRSGALVVPTVGARLPFCSTCGGNGQSIGRLAFGPGGDLVAAGTDARVRRFELDPPGIPMARTIASGTTPSSGLSAMSADGRVLASLRFGVGELDIVDARRGGVMRVLAAPVGNLEQLALSPDGRYVALAVAVVPPGSIDTTVVETVWRTSGELLWQRRVDGAAYAGTLTFDPTGSILATVTVPPLSGSVQAASVLELRSVTDGTPIGPPIELPGDYAALAYSPDGRVIVATSFGAYPPVVVGVADHRIQRTLTDRRLATSAQILFSVDGRMAVAAGFSSSTVVVLDPATWTVRREFDTGISATEATLSPDGSRIAVASADAGVQLFSTATGDPLGDRLGPTGGEVRSHQVTLTGSQLVAVSGDDIYRVDLGLRSLEARACAVADRDLTRQEWTATVGPGVPLTPTCPAG